MPTPLSTEKVKELEDHILAFFHEIEKRPEDEYIFIKATLYHLLRNERWNDEEARKVRIKNKASA